MIDPFKTKASTNLKKAKTHIEKILSMIEKNEYCPEIMQQILAVQGYLKSTNSLVLQSHLETCGAKLASKNTDEKEKFIHEIIKASGLAQK